MIQIVSQSETTGFFYVMVSTSVTTIPTKPKYPLNQNYLNYT